MVNDELDNKCINLCFKNDKIRQGTTQHLPEKIKAYLNNRYEDSESLVETLYRIKLNIEKRPVCKMCGNKVKFYKKRFNTYCSCKCAMNDKENIDKVQKSRNEHIDQFKENYKKTCILKYGVENAFMNENIKNKIRRTCLDKFGNEYYVCTDDMKNKTKKTCLNKYGVEYTWQADEVKRHSQETLMKHYNVKSPMKCASIRNKINDAKRKNHTFNTSKKEEECYKMLLEKFGDVKRQYSNKSYPFNCDFYIPNLNTFIEYQGSWTHGNHPFDKNNELDVNTLNDWKNKNTEYYNNAIDVWTRRDPLKRETAKNNNINLLEIWSINEMRKWINSQ